jgi:hypothetical protein
MPDSPDRDVDKIFSRDKYSVSPSLQDVDSDPQRPDVTNRPTAATSILGANGSLLSSDPAAGAINAGPDGMDSSGGANHQTHLPSISPNKDSDGKDPSEAASNSKNKRKG